MYLLDTVICIQLLAGNQTITRKLEELDGPASISVVIQHKLTLISQDEDFKRLQGFEGLKVNIW